jgi:ribonuclease HI
MRRTIQNLFRRPGSFFALTKPNLLMIEESTKIQTDGSFKIQNNRISRTAVILTKPDGIKYSLCKTYFDHSNSCESEWCSVVDGLTYAIKKDVKSVNLENDNLGVMNSLIQKNKPSGLYSDYYYFIFELVKRFDHLAIRWIPRGLNKADKLFRV